MFLRLPEYENNISHWPHREIKAFEPAAGGEVLFVPSKRLDAIIILENSNPITLVQNQTNDSGPRVER